MKVNSLKLNNAEYPETLRQLSTPPQQIYYSGIELDDVLAKPKIAIVGSRKATAYGRQVTEELSFKLASRGAVIISGLAFGVDSCAHRAAIKANGCTVAILPSPIDKIAPASHQNLAEGIVASGGGLISEYPSGSRVHVVNFIARNRIVAALSDVLLITEAAKNSGSLHTARFALDQGKTVMAVPGNINSPLSEGCNNLIKSGAIPVTNADDIFFALNIDPDDAPIIRVFKGSPDQQLIFDLISRGINGQEQLAVASRLSGSQISSTLITLELQGYIRPMGAGNWTAS